LVVVVDSSKFGRRSLVRLCGLDQVDHMVTDHGIDEEWRDRLDQAGAKLHVAELPGEGEATGDAAGLTRGGSFEGM